MHYITNPFFVYLLNDIKVQKKPFLIRLIKSYGTLSIPGQTIL